ncbi:MAG: hypothetical protein ACLGXA_09345 [Acidobacteriota bacterium]
MLPFRFLKNRKFQFAVATVVSLIAARAAWCSDVVFVDSQASPSYTRQQVEAAARVYGIDVHTVTVGDASAGEAAAKAIVDPQTIAVILTANAVQSPDGLRLLSVIDHARKQMPVMIAGIDEQTHADVLQKWSNGLVQGAGKATVGANASYLVAGNNSVTRELGGEKLPTQERSVRYLNAKKDGGERWLIAASDGNSQYPVLIDANVDGREVFFVTAPAEEGTQISDDLLGSPFLFPVIAPEILFLHSAAGDRAWHYPEHFANLTIDDIWLRQPYGYVDYYALLHEMQEHNFHTTLAFIPWNYDRSQPQLVKLFREHPDRYSISVHGDNHDHQEFGPVSTRPLSGQIADMKQGLARMAEFHRLTGLPWDPVMVFPHKMSPEATLGALKRYNYWATVNTINIPSDVAAPPPDPEIGLRPMTLAFADFPSVRRYSAEETFPHWLLAMDAFLGNPMLFYCHEAFFANGIGDFDRFADEVNRLQPDTKWSNLGEITKHLYLEKRRDDGNYDVNLFSAVASLTNSTGHDGVFYLEKEENGADPFKVTVDGQVQPYTLENGWLRLQVPIQAGASREVAVVYQNDLVLSQVDISKHSLRVAALRHLSDFRDDVVSRSSAGRWFIRSYVANRSTWNHGAEAGFGVILIGLILVWRRAKKKRNGVAA